MAASTIHDQAGVSVEDKLKALYMLQQVDSEIDKIRTLRGELPLEVSDLEDELTGLQTRIEKIESDIKAKEQDVLVKQNEIRDAKAQIKKFEEQQKNVRNSREFESLSKEIEYQNLEIELCNKRIREFNQEIESKRRQLDNTQRMFAERTEDLEHKQSELNSIVSETQSDENDLAAKSAMFEAMIEPRLISAYKRIRSNARNGLSVVNVERDACGGCFNKIPPQRQLDIKTHKKIIVCEYCGRILVDAEGLVGEAQPKYHEAE